MARTHVQTKDGMLPIDSTELCDLMELPKVQCGHCRVPVPKPLFLSLDDDPDAADPNLIVATFAAAYGGRCAECGEHFARGAWISKTFGGDYLCSECAS